jgi:two-component system LytT family response regulator
LAVKTEGVEKNLPVKDIDYFEASGNYLLIHTGTQRLIHRATMQEMERTLTPGPFLRIHRSYLVNRFAIRQVNYRANHEYEVALKSGVLLKSGRNYKHILEAYLHEMGS